MKARNMKKLGNLTIILMSLLLASACSTDRVQLNYDTTGITSSGGVAPSISSVNVTDSRGTAADWLGAIRGGMGNPVRTLLTEVPVKEMIQQAFIQGLKARGMLSNSGNGKLDLTVDIIKFDCSQYQNREAHANFRVSLRVLKSQRKIFDKSVRVDRILKNPDLFDVALFASAEDLRKVANNALQEAIDKTLDDPAFRSTLTQITN